MNHTVKILLLLTSLLPNAILSTPLRNTANFNSSETPIGEFMNNWFNEINHNVLIHNRLAADIAWKASVNPYAEGLADEVEQFEGLKTKWRTGTCGDLLRVKPRYLSKDQRRQAYLLCRGARFTKNEARLISGIFSEIQGIYTQSQICIPRTRIPTADEDVYSTTYMDGTIGNFLDSIRQDLEKAGDFDEKDVMEAALAYAVAGPETASSNVDCYSGEPDLERLMTRSRQEAVLRFTWLAWRRAVGPPMRSSYAVMVRRENAAAARNGYSDIGEVWREELETPNLEELVEDLYSDVKSLYVELHGVVRYFLGRHYGAGLVPPGRPIPAHLLGNMWGQNWDPILDLILGKDQLVDLDERISRTNWSTVDMVKRAEDYYTSMGLPALTRKFWKYSVLGEARDSSTAGSTSKGGQSLTRCHGTAANMYQKDDYRMIYCAKLSMEDFYVVHHEVGHIQYYMAYQNMPALFQDGTNSAFQESIGDAIMYGVMTPQHLYRLGLIDDTSLYSHSKRSVLNRDINESTEFKTDRQTTDDLLGRTDEYYGDDDGNADFNEIGDNVNSKTDELSLSGPDSEKSKNEFGNISKSKFVAKKSDYVYGEGDHDDTKTFDEDFNSKYEELKAKHIQKRDSREDYRVLEQYERLYDEITKSKNAKRKRDRERTADAGASKVSFDEALLLRQALTKLPQIPFGLIMDKYRWGIFSGRISEGNYNGEFWKLVMNYQGIAPPDGEVRDERYFDAGAKFHVPDNTPYIRYFLGSFLQVQLFRGLCRERAGGGAPGPRLPLHRCDLYGAKTKGKILRGMVSRGSSVRWDEALRIATGESRVGASALLEYFAPLRPLLARLIRAHRIPLGW